MNFYTTHKQSQSYNGNHSGVCCAHAEAVLNNVQGTPEFRVKKCLEVAMNNRRTYLTWFLTPTISTVHKDAMDIVAGLPATYQIGEHINPNSGNLVCMFVTDLRKEWVDETQS